MTPTPRPAPRVPLGILDLVPISSGSTAQRALRNTIDLVRTAEQLGYRRYWFAEHHLNPGVAGSAPALLIAMAAAATDHIRVGSGGVQSGHRTAALRGRGVRSSRRHAPGAYRPGHRKVWVGATSCGTASPQPARVGVAPVGEEAALLPSHGERAADPGRAIAARAGQHGEIPSHGGPAAAEERRVGRVRRSPVRHPRPPARHLSLGRWARSPSGTRDRRRCRALGARQQRGRERGGGRATRDPFRGQLPHQPGHRPGRGRRLSCRVRPLGGARSPLCRRLGRCRGGAG